MADFVPHQIHLVSDDAITSRGDKRKNTFVIKLGL